MPLPSRTQLKRTRLRVAAVCGLSTVLSLWAAWYEPAARKGVECRLGGSIIKIASRKKTMGCRGRRHPAGPGRGCHGAGAVPSRLGRRWPSAMPVNEELARITVVTSAATFRQQLIRFSSCFSALFECLSRSKLV
jgi:hypothetical protein